MDMQILPKACKEKVFLLLINPWYNQDVIAFFKGKPVNARRPQKPMPPKSMLSKSTLPKAALSNVVPVRNLGLRFTPVALVLFSLTLMAFHRIDALPIERLRTALTDLVAPTLYAVSQPFVTAIDSFEGLRTLRALKSENMRLHEENARLLQWYEAALKYQSENRSLHDLLNVKADPQISYVTARVVADPGGSFVKSVLLPVGSKDGVRKGNAVVSGQGLVGRVTEAGRHSARVLLVSDLNSRIPVVIQNTRTKAILAGKNGAFLRLERLPIDSGLDIGSRVVTSGDGGLLPPDIPVGTIVKVDKTGVLVKPLADLEGLSYVQVVNTALDESLLTGAITETAQEAQE
jgi:rod shape-determining protein MreC